MIDRIVDEFLKKQKRKEGGTRGRPVVNPFSDPEVEAELYLRAAEIVKLCYRPSEDNQKKPFLLQPTAFTPKVASSFTIQYLKFKQGDERGIPPIRLGTTAFWALIYLYYNSEFGVDNLDHFVANLRLRIGPDVVGARTSICANLSKYKARYVEKPYALDSDILKTKHAIDDYCRDRIRYDYAVAVWGILPPRLLN